MTPCSANNELQTSQNIYNERKTKSVFESRGHVCVHSTSGTFGSLLSPSLSVNA